MAILPEKEGGTFTESEFTSGSMEIRYFDNLIPVSRGFPLPTFEPSYYYTTLTNGGLNNFMLRLLKKNIIENGLFINSRLFTDFKGLNNIFYGKPLVCYRRPTKLARDGSYDKFFVYHPVTETGSNGNKTILKRFIITVDAFIKSKKDNEYKYFFLSLSALPKKPTSLKYRPAFDDEFNTIGYIESENDKFFWKRTILSVHNDNVKADIFQPRSKLKRVTANCQDPSIFVSPLGIEAICKMAMDLRADDLEKQLNIGSFDFVKALDIGRHSFCRRE